MKRLLVLGSLIFLIVALVLTGCVSKKVNHPPEIVKAMLSSETTQAGSPVTLEYEVSDPDGDPVTVTVDWGDNTDPDTSTSKKGSFAHTYDQAKIYTITFKVKDDKGEEVSKTLQVTVAPSVPPNTPPKITDFYVEEGNFFENDSIPATLVVTDPDQNESLKVRIYWTTEPTGFGYESVEFTGKTPGTIPVNFKISKEGTYYIWAEVEDSKGASATTRGVREYVRTVYENHTPGITLTVTPNSTGNVDTNFTVTVTVNYNGDDVVRDDIDKVEIDFGAPNTYKLSDTWNPRPDNKTKVWPPFQYRHIGPITIVATVTDDAGNKATATKVVTIENRLPTISINVTSIPVYRGDKLGFNVVVEDQDSGKADNENVTYIYEVKVDDTSWYESNEKSLVGASVTDTYGPSEVDKLGTYSIVATVTDCSGEEVSTSTVVNTVINREPVIDSIVTKSVYYEDETFVATVNVVDADVDKGYDTLAGTFTLVSGRRIEGEITFQATTGTIIIDPQDTSLDPATYTLYVKVWDTPGGGEAEKTVPSVLVKSRLYANVTLWYEWYDGEEEETVGPYGTKQNHSVVAMDPIYLRVGSDNFDEPATLVVKIDVTNITTPRKVELEWRLDNGNIRDFYDDDADEDGYYTIGVDFLDFFLASPTDYPHTVTGDVYVVSGDDESDRVKVATMVIYFVEGNDPTIEFEVSTPTSTSPAPAPMVTGAGTATPSGTCSEEAIIEYGATLTINDESLYEYTVTVEKNGAVVGTKAGTNTGGNATSLYYRNDLYDLGLALDFYECAAEFTVTVAATDFPDNNNWPYGSNYVTSWTFTVADQASPLTKAWFVTNGSSNLLNVYSLYGATFVGNVTEAYFTNSSGTIWFHGKLFDYHYAEGELTARNLETGAELIDDNKLYNNSSEANKAPWDRDWVSEQVGMALVPQGIYEIMTVATDLCGHAASDATYLVVDWTAPTGLATLVATCTDSDASGTVDFDIDVSDNWLLDDHDLFNASNLTFGLNTGEPYYIEAGYDANDLVISETVTGTHTVPSPIGSAPDSLDYAGSYTIATDISYEGTFTLSYTIYDIAGNMTTITDEIFVDRAAPRVTVATVNNLSQSDNDLQFLTVDSTIVATLVVQFEDLGTHIATITTSGASLVLVDATVDAYSTPLVTGYGTCTFTLKSGTYNANESVVGSITVTATDPCADSADSDIAAWHTTTVTYYVTIDELKWNTTTNNYFHAFEIHATTGSSDVLLIVLRNENMTSDTEFATASDNVQGIKIYHEIDNTGIFTQVGTGASLTLDEVGPDYAIYKVTLEDEADDIIANETYKVIIPAGLFKFHYKTPDVHFLNPYYEAYPVNAVNYVPEQ